ncbi:MAG: hypothetical protein HYZ59_01470 [Actinobacteria bacterium]|nr:hypothetical protein [Actinomycetota bacterium]
MGTSFRVVLNAARCRARYAVTAGAVVAGLLTFQPAAQAAGPCDAPVQSVIQCENSKTGNPASEWDVAGTGSTNINGFADDISYLPGAVVNFRVKTVASAYRLDIYRMGYYGGKGARKMATIQPSVALPQTQPTCLGDTTTGLVDCGNWEVSAQWTIPAGSVSGIYFAKLVREDGTAGSNHVVFVVRNDTSGSDLLFQTSDTTWQAYNKFGGNSLYSGSPDGRAYKVSYNRPFTTRATGAQDWVFNAEYPMVRWLEQNGYDVSYTSGIDTDRRGAELKEHNVFMSVGHDEYWSGQQRANVEAARAAGVHLAFLSGNAVFWKTRWEDSISSPTTSYRTLVTYKESKANAKIDPDPAWTGTWRDGRFSPPSDGGRPENALMGTLFAVNGPQDEAITVPQADGLMRLWRNTSVATLGDGEVATFPTGTLGYEWDEEVDNGFRPAGLVPLSSTTINVQERLQDTCCTYAAGPATHRLTLYRHSSGALVFGAGTIQWSWGLDATHDRSGPAADQRMQQATVNLFADMGVQPASLQAPLSAATTSSDTSGPTTKITSPAAGATLAVNTAVTMTGTATDAGGGRVGAVEVSTDNGSTWHPAIGRENWSYTWTPTSSGTSNLKARSADDSGNLGAAVSPATTPPTTTPPTTTPPTTTPPTTTPPTTTPPTTVAPAASPTPSVAFASSNPVGSFDVGSMAPGGLRIAGWALDPDSTDPIGVHVYVNGTFVRALDANASRPDIGSAYPGFGDSHGFDTGIRANPGSFNVCAYGINTGPGDNVLLGCRVVNVPGDPFGSFDVGTMAPGGTRLAGWAIDADTASPIGVHVYVDNAFAGAFDASVDRPDIGSAYPGFGDAHGFDTVLSIAPGFHTVCAYGINQGGGANALIGCRWVMVTTDPMGSFDVASMTAGGLRVAGWVLDPDTAGSLSVHVYVDNAFAGALDANATRPDIGSAYPGFGDAHGFDSVIPTGAGSHTVCVYGINQGAGGNVLIGCRSV